MLVKRYLILYLISIVSDNPAKTLPRIMTLPLYYEARFFKQIIAKNSQYLVFFPFTFPYWWYSRSRFFKIIKMKIFNNF